MLQRPIPFDLDSWIEKNPLARSSPLKKSLPSFSPSNRSQDAYDQARAFILKVKPAISGQGGRKQLFYACCSLLKGFCLTLAESKSLLDIWNSTCIPVWSHQELESSLLSAQKSPDFQPQGWLITKPEYAFGKACDRILEEPQPKEETAHNHSGILDDPASLAIKFMEDHKTDIGLCSYRWWQGQFYKWNDIHYKPITEKVMNSYIFEYMEKLFLKQYMIKCAEVPKGDDISKIRKNKVKHSLAEDVKTYLINLISISDENTSEPFFLEPPPAGWNADEIIPTKDRLVHLPSFVSCSPECHAPKTPKYFSTYSLKYKFPYDFYSGPVEPPPVWKNFLQTVWPDDKDSIICLQEFFGYFLTPCTKLEKMLMLIGQKRSGKGTIIRTLKHMLGNENVCFPTFKSLTTEFGKQSLIGRSLAIFPDARITARTDTGDVVEILLSITGEDDQTVPRKYLSSLTTHLTSRFIISSNELPRLTENSGALVTRAIVLKFDQTFLGVEDIELEEKLIPEIPAILRWAVDGYKRLYERKKFEQPESGAQLVSDFLHLSSPISHFISDSVDIGMDYTSDTRSMYLGWRSWCDWNGRDNPGDMDTFLRNLRSAVPRLDFSGPNISHNGDGASRKWAKPVRGVRLREEPETSLVLVSSEANGHTDESGRIPF
jgi:putative DNA primase/helicase